jgi:hypothetical protein
MQQTQFEEDLSTDTMAQNAPINIAQQLANLAAQLTHLQGEVTNLHQENVTLTNTNTALTGQVTTLAAAAAAMPAVPNVAAQAAPQAAIMFATTPTMLRHEDIIDYLSKTRTMMYEDGCESLTTPFKMKSNCTVIYITKLQAKSNHMGWHLGTQQIIKFANNLGTMINIIYEYGQISMAKLQTECKDFLKAGGAQCNLRAYQNNQMKAKCIMKMLYANARAWLLPFWNMIEHNNLVYAPLLHKKVMALVTINTVATTKTLRSNPREILTYWDTIKGDIDLFHSYFDNNYSQIIAQGATVDNPVNILFTAYSVVPCAHFCLYIKGKHDNYTNSTSTYTHEQLILLALNKYNLLVQEDIFGVKSLEEEKIIAMQAELTALKGQFILAPNLQCAAGDKKDGEKKDHVKKEQNKGKKKTKNNTENKEKQKQMEKRQHVPPKDGKSQEKKHSNQIY